MSVLATLDVRSGSPLVLREAVRADVPVLGSAMISWALAEATGSASWPVTKA
jgi:hypothetical protein